MRILNKMDLDEGSEWKRVPQRTRTHTNSIKPKPSSVLYDSFCGKAGASDAVVASITSVASPSAPSAIPAKTKNQVKTSKDSAPKKTKIRFDIIEDIRTKFQTFTTCTQIEKDAIREYIMASELTSAEMTEMNDVFMAELRNMFTQEQYLQSIDRFIRFENKWKV